ncbi:MAG TPA: TolC family protein [Kofleriaceae bacterium]|nr:TolC family protein [Kofleriaceae bacterium]
MGVFRPAGVLVYLGLASDAFAQPGKTPPAPPPPSPAAANTIKLPGVTTGKETRLTLAEAVRSALAHNPDVVRARLDTKIAEVEIKKQRGAFDPVLKAEGFARREGTYVIDSTLTANGVNDTDLVGVDSSITGRTTFGGTYSINFSANRTADRGDPAFFVRLVPQFDNVLFARYTQALRRDAGFTPNRGLIDRAQLQADLLSAEQRERLEQFALKVVGAYWDLVVRHQRVSISEANLQDAIKLRDFVERQVRAGRGAQSDVTQADLTVAERQQALDTAVLAVIEGERALLDVTFLRQGAIPWDERLTLVDLPATEPVKKNFDQELKVALDKRPEFRRQQRAIEVARINEDIAENQTRIRFDVYGEAGVVGFSGTNAAGSMIGTPPPLVLGGIGKSFSNMIGFNAPFFEVGVQLEIPIGNRERSAAARQASLAVEKERAIDIRSLVIHDVRAAFQRLATASHRLEIATGSVKLAVQNVTAQESRYRNGAGILFDVTRAQEQLAAAQAAAALAAAEQEVALMQLEAARGTLLAKLGVTK